MLEFFEPYKNLFLQSSLSLSLILIIVFLKIPIFYLYGLFTYIHPDNLSNGVRAAIRRPDASDSGNGSNPKPGTDLRKRTKAKDKFEFDESNAQIFRLKLDDAHLQSRLYFDHYRNAFSLSLIAIASLTLHAYLDYGSEKKGVLESGVFVPISLGLVALLKLLLSMIKISFEKSASRRLEKQLSVCFTVLGVILGSLIGLRVASSVLDFDLDFGSVDGFGRFLIAVLMGSLAGLLFVPATKIARSFWLGTDQIKSNLSMITCGWFARVILYANYLIITFTPLLWLKPFSGMLVNKETGSVSEIRNAPRLLGHVGFSQSEFANLRILGLFLSGVLQIVALRPNLQMYLNEALLSWYQRLHASKVPDLDYSRAKVFLHNHYLCLVVLQFLAPPSLVLIFLGFSRVDANYQFVSSALAKEVALFMAWWVTFVSAIYTSATIALFRRGDLLVS